MHKPQGIYFEACAAGKFLLVEPHAEVLERQDIASRYYKPMAGSTACAIPPALIIDSPAKEGDFE